MIKGKENTNNDSKTREFSNPKVVTAQQNSDCIMEEDAKKKIMKLFCELHKLRLDDIRDEDKEETNHRTIEKKEIELVHLLDANPLIVHPYFRRERDYSDFPTYEFVRVFEYFNGTYSCIILNSEPEHFSCSMETVGLIPLCQNYHPITKKNFMSAYNKVGKGILSKVTQGCQEENEKLILT